MGAWRKLGNPNWNSIYEFSERIEDILEFTLYDVDSLLGQPSNTDIRNAGSRKPVTPETGILTDALFFLPSRLPTLNSFLNSGLGEIMRRLAQEIRCTSLHGDAE